VSDAARAQPPAAASAAATAAQTTNFIDYALLVWGAFVSLVCFVVNS
jgi:hypothetical protein